MLFTGLIILAVHITLSSARQGNCEESGPICGNDGNTYPTMCQLIWAKLEDADLAVLHEGSCKAKYLASLQQMGGYDVQNGSGKVDYEKITAVMPVGWPPLGPLINFPITSRSSQTSRSSKQKSKRKRL